MIVETFSENCHVQYHRTALPFLLFLLFRSTIPKMHRPQWDCRTSLNLAKSGMVGKSKISRSTAEIKLEIAKLGEVPLRVLIFNFTLFLQCVREKGWEWLPFC